MPGKPDDYSDEQLNDLLTLTDVMATGYHHAANPAHGKKGDTTVVMGDGSVRLCGVIAAHLRGAIFIILMSRHADRQALGKEFGVADFFPERGDEAVKHVMALTDNAGADSVLECGNRVSNEDCFGHSVGGVGVPQKAPMASLTDLFGAPRGTASVPTYDRQVLLKAVLDGQIHPGHVFTKRFDLDHINDAYSAWTSGRQLKPC